MITKNSLSGRILGLVVPSYYCAIALTAAFLFSLMGCASSMEKGDVLREQKDYEKKAYTHGRSGPMSVTSPLNHFLLIRKGNDGCAIRFTSFHRDYDESSSSIFYSGEENKYAEYDWYYQGDGSFDFSKDNVKSGHGKLHHGPAVGIGRMAFKIGQKYWIECGSFNLQWTYPIRLAFASSEGKLDRIVELAPTKWTKIEEVDFKNSKLQWSRLEKQAERYIPMDELP